MYSFFKADFINCTWSVQLWIDKYHVATPVAREKQVRMPQGWGTTLSKWKLWLQWIVVSPSSGVKLKESTAGVDGQEGKKCLGLHTQMGKELSWGTDISCSGHTEWLTYVDICKAFCTDGIHSAFVYCVETKTSKLRFIKQTSLERLKNTS